MKELIIDKLGDNQRLDKYLSKYLSAASKSFIYKMLRKKNIKLNSKKAEGNEMLSDGDKVEITDGLSEGDTVYYQKTGNTQGTDSGQTPQQGGGPGNMEQPSGGGMGEMPSGGGPAPGGN